MRRGAGAWGTLDAAQGRLAHGADNPCMAKKFPIEPAHPERTCWGCDNFCAADSMICGNGTERTQHPIELFGKGWERLGSDPFRPATEALAEPEVPAGN